MNRKADKSSSGSRVTFKKQLVRNPVETNKRAVVIKESEKVEQLKLGDVCFNSEPPSRYQPLAKKSLADIDASMSKLSLTSRSLNASRTSSSEKDSKRSMSPEKITSLNNPSMHSTLNLNKKIDNLGKIRPSSVKNKRAFDEKVTRQVNFPYEKKIYKDLMPLSSPNKFVQKTITSRDPMPPRDIEPVLENFIKQPTVEEYSYVPNFKLETKKSRAHCNNLRLYKVLQFLEKC